MVNLIKPEIEELIVTLLSKGLTIRQIANQTGASTKTVLKRKHLLLEQDERANRTSKEKLDPVMVQAALRTACVKLRFKFEDLAKASLRASSARQRMYAYQVRAYAALSIRALVEFVSYCDIASAVGANNPRQFIPRIDYFMKRDTLPWWDDDVFMAVVEATEKAVDESRSGKSQGVDGYPSHRSIKDSPRQLGGCC